MPHRKTTETTPSAEPVLSPRRRDRHAARRKPPGGGRASRALDRCMMQQVCRWSRPTRPGPPPGTRPWPVD